jgi:hypothetical protein
MPRVEFSYGGLGIHVRIDDESRPEFWLILELDPEELQMHLTQWKEWRALNDTAKIPTLFNNGNQLPPD